MTVSYNSKGYLNYADSRFVYFINHEYVGGSKLANSFYITSLKQPKKRD